MTQSIISKMVSARFILINLYTIPTLVVDGLVEKLLKYIEKNSEQSIPQDW